MRHDLHSVSRPLAIWFLAAAVGAGLLCADVPAPRGGTGGDPLSGTLTVTVVAAGSADPIDGAFVMVGSAEDAPFPGNVGVTDGSGQVVFSDNALVGSVIVTAGGAGRAYTTLFDCAVNEIVLPLAPIEPTPTVRLGDSFDGIEVNNGFLLIGDGNLDIGLVLSAIPIDRILSPSSLIESIFSSSVGPLSTPLGPVNVPSNLYAPNQFELFLPYQKLSYHLRTAVGRQSIFGLTARGSLGAFLDAAEGELTIDSVLALLNELDFREMDILRDVDVVADSEDFDLNADLDLSNDLTLQVANAQPATAVFAAAGGRLPTPDGGEELIVTGVGGFDPDQVGSAADVELSTRPSIGELSDMTHGALVTLLRDGDSLGQDGATTALVRSGFMPPAALVFDTFFEIVEIDSADDATYFWTDVRSATSPATREVNRSQLLYESPAPDPDDPGAEITEVRLYWTLYTPGDDQSLTLPLLPEMAPTALPDPGSTQQQDILVVSHEVFGLGDAVAFDYDAFSLDDVSMLGTHVSSNRRVVRCDVTEEVDRLMLARGPDAEQLTLSWRSSRDVCLETASQRSYEVYAGDDARPRVDPGSWPTDPTFLKVTDEDLDVSLADTSFTHAMPSGTTFYLVVDRGLTGNEGPAGHYGSAPF